MSQDIDLGKRNAATEELSSAHIRIGMRRGIRMRSHSYIFGIPFYEIAIGPDSKRRQSHGRARAIVAIGDVATGLIALGGIARGFIAVGGLAIGAVSIGGLSLGLLLAVGGFAMGGVALGGIAAGGFVLGGIALGYAALGGIALGYHACGGLAVGAHIVTSLQQDPAAVQFFSQWMPGFAEWSLIRKHQVL